MTETTILDVLSYGPYGATCVRCDDVAHYRTGIATYCLVHAVANAASMASVDTLAALRRYALAWLSEARYQRGIWARRTMVTGWQSRAELDAIALTRAYVALDNAHNLLTAWRALTDRPSASDPRVTCPRCEWWSRPTDSGKCALCGHHLGTC